MLEEMGLLYEEGRWGPGRVYMLSIPTTYLCLPQFQVCTPVWGISPRALRHELHLHQHEMPRGTENQAHKRCSGGSS